MKDSLEEENRKLKIEVASLEERLLIYKDIYIKYRNVVPIAEYILSKIEATDENKDLLFNYKKVIEEKEILLVLKDSYYKNITSGNYELLNNSLYINNKKVAEFFDSRFLDLFIKLIKYFPILIKIYSILKTYREVSNEFKDHEYFGKYLLREKHIK